MKFLAEAVSKDITRAHMMAIHAEEADGMMILVSTDGQRLHKISYPLGEAPVNEAGDYTVVAKKADIIVLEKIANPGKFPNWRSVTPVGKIRLYDCLTFSKEDFDKDYYKLCRIGILVNSGFLMPLGNTIKPLAWSLAKDRTENDNLAALLFTADNRAAAIMPMLDDGTDRAIALAKERLEEAAVAPAPALSAPEPQPPALDVEAVTMPEPKMYWLETYGGRPHLTAGTPEEWKRIEHFQTKTKISAEVYGKAKAAFSLDWLGSFEEAAIERWQQEFDAQAAAETMPEPAPVKPEKAAADKPMKIPAPVKKDAVPENRVIGSRYVEYSDTEHGFVVRTAGKKTKEYDGYAAHIKAGFGAVITFETAESAEKWMTGNPVRRKTRETRQEAQTAPEKAVTVTAPMAAPEPAVQPAPYVNILPDSWIAAWPVSSTQQRRFAAAFMLAHYLIWRYTVNVDNETETKIIERLDRLVNGMDKLV
jgi:hypothetical protein